MTILLMVILCAANMYSAQSFDDQGYFSQLCSDVQRHSQSFGESLEVFKKRLKENWTDPHNRMLWVHDLKQDILDPLQAVCEGDHLAGVSKTLDTDFHKCMGRSFKASMQHLREYVVLLDVAQLAYMQDDKGGYLSFLDVMYQCTPHLFAKKSFQDFCKKVSLTCLTSSQFPDLPYQFPKATVLQAAKSLCSIEASGFRAACYPCADGEFLIPAKLAALSKGILLQGMPYMVKNFDYASCYKSLLQDFMSSKKFHDFNDQLRGSACAAQFLALWRCLLPSEKYPDQFLIEEMKAQMERASGYMMGSQKSILLTFYQMIFGSHSLYLLLPRNQKEFISGFANHKVQAMLPEVEAELNVMYDKHSQQDTMLQCLQRWKREYFCLGIRNIVCKSVWGYNLCREMNALSHSYGLRSGVKADILYVLDTMVQTFRGYGTLDQHINKLYENAVSEGKISTEIDEQTFSETMHRCLAQVQNFKWTLWDLPIPVFDWSKSRDECIVCLPSWDKCLPSIEGLRDTVMESGDWGLFLEALGNTITDDQIIKGIKRVSESLAENVCSRKKRHKI